jgi:arsenate reductase (glutaredoxin)
MSTTLYGIKNCDTVRKARRWLEQRGVAYRFHDLRSDGLEPDRLRQWCRTLGWETLLNRRGRTFRELPDEQIQGLDGRGALELMLAHPTLIKRPVLERDGRLQVGFDESLYATLFTA